MSVLAIRCNLCGTDDRSELIQAQGGITCYECKRQTDLALAVEKISETLDACIDCGTASRWKAGDNQPRCATCHLAYNQRLGEQWASHLAQKTKERRDAAPGWFPQNLEPFLSGNHEPERPKYLRRDDGHALLYPGRLHSISGEPESGKGWLMLAAAMEFLTGEQINGVVLYIDFEDQPNNLVARLRALGVGDEVIRRRFAYVRPEEPIRDSREIDDLVLACGDDVFLVVLDGVTEGMVLHGLDPLSNTDIAQWRELVVRPLLHGGPAVVEIDHVVKDKENRGRYAIGGVHKLAGVDVAYGVKVLEPFGRGRSGKLKVTVHKDRPGHVRGFATDNVAAIIDITSHGADGVRVTVKAPEDGHDSAAAFRPTHLMERVAGAIAATPGLTKNGIRAAVNGKHEYRDLALELLVSEGYVDARPGPNRSVEHHLIHPFDPECPRGPQVPPEWPRGHRPTPVPPCPPPYTGHRAPGDTVDGLPLASPDEEALAARHADIHAVEEAA